MPDENIFEKLLQQDIDSVQTWLNENLGSQPPYSAEPNEWLGIAEIASNRAHSTNNIRWARIAVRVYEFLANKKDPDGRSSYLVSAMHLRVNMIREFGPISGDEILDPDLVVRWFFDELKLPLSEVEQLADLWAKRTGTTWGDLELSPAEMLFLRGIKNRLNVLRSMVNIGQITPSEELIQWLALRDKLP